MFKTRVVSSAAAVATLALSSAATVPVSTALRLGDPFAVLNRMSKREERKPEPQEVEDVEQTVQNRGVTIKIPRGEFDIDEFFANSPLLQAKEKSPMTPQMPQMTQMTQAMIPAEEEVKEIPSTSGGILSKLKSKLNPLTWF